MKYYGRVLWTFFVNALVREMSFRSNFVINFITRAFWFTAQIVLFELIYGQVASINDWSRAEYFAFMATGMLINALVEAFFMPNCAAFSETIRTGNLDFALLKPIDTQFLVSLEKMDLSMITQVLFAVGLLGYALLELGRPISLGQAITYICLVAAAVAFFYSLMISLACTSIWFGRNQGLLDFWFYVTIFARYPSSIYSGSVMGEVIRFLFSYVIPILLVVTVPARVVTSMLLDPKWGIAMTLALAGLSLLVSRRVFQFSLTAYRSASS